MLVILFDLDMTLDRVMPVKHQQIVLVLVKIEFLPALLVIIPVEADALLVEREAIDLREQGQQLSILAVQVLFAAEVDHFVVEVTIVSLQLVALDRLVVLACQEPDKCGQQVFIMILRLLTHRVVQKAGQLILRVDYHLIRHANALHV